MKKRFWTSEKLLSLTALLVSLLTLFVFIYQTNLIRQQQYMSVYPYLNLSNEYSGTLKYNYTLTNEGIGPAIIESINITTSNSKVYNDFVDYVDNTVAEEDTIWYFHSNLTTGRLIPSNKKIPLIQIVNEDMLLDMGIKNFDGLPMNTLDDAKKLYHILNNDSLNVEIVYSSIYGEKWSVKNHGTAPVKL